MLKLKQDIPLAPFSTFKVGGNAKLYVQVSTEDALFEALNFAQQNHLEVFVLGGGSNVLISDKGFDGLVIHNEIYFLDKTIGKDTATVKVGAGVRWDDFVSYCVDNSWQGIECLSGIPGRVGASVVSNIGAYGQQVSDVVQCVQGFEIKTLKGFVLRNEDCKFSYRNSIFTNNDYAISAVIFALRPHGISKIAYKELAHYIGVDACSDLMRLRQAVLEIRQRKGMLIKGDNTDLASVGSFFKNPKLTKSHFEAIRDIIKGQCSNWFWAIDNEHYKVSAGCLIECSGFRKGLRVGSTGISPYHSLCIVNYGGSTAQEILDFAMTVKEAVYKKFEVTLELEVRLVGF